ncbi:hypothetical protein ACS0TY_001472 [Phlomoides rotata]
MEDDTGEKSSFIVGLIENRAKEVGVAAFDLRSASFDLSQYIETSSSYQNTKTLLNFYDPMVIIVTPAKTAPDGMVGVSELVDRFCSSTTKVIMARGCFDDTRGAALVKSLAANEPSALGLDSYSKQYYLCLAAAAATIKWIEAEKGLIITNHSLSVTFNGSFGHMNIDATSVRNLEIIEPMHSSLWGSSNKKRSLFHMLKTTRTVGGTRLLRANLLQPLKDVETINARLDCLDELMGNEQLFFGLSQALRKFPKETDKVLCHFCFKQKKVTNGVMASDSSRKSQILISSIVVLKRALDALPLLSKVLKDANCYLLKNIYKSICENEKFATMRKRSGKSTFLQQVCLVVILAQIGCYVPARFATLRVVDRIFTRMGTMDSVESNSSTFMTEMKEMAFILQNASHRSLIVVDELGRATSSSDGFAIAWSCCEHLLALRAYTIFATHMENLSELATIYPNVKIVHFDVEIMNKRMDFKFQLKDGPRHVAHYGLMLAEVAGLPSLVMECAKSITSKITQGEVKRMEVNFEQHHDLQMAYRVAQRLVCLKYSNQDGDSILEALQNLKGSCMLGGL